MKKILPAILCGLSAAMAFGGPIDDARQLVKEGDFWGARKSLEQALAANPKVASTAEYNYLLGACEFDAENYDNARRLLEAAKSKGYGYANLYLGRLAFLDYDFEEATSLYDTFIRYREKLGQPAGETVEELKEQVTIAENALSRVEKIAVIDSISVPQDDFFRHYKLSRSAGQLVAPEQIPFADSRQGALMAFVNEGGDYMMWGEPDSIGNVHLVESLRLTDGTWQEPHAVADHLSGGGYADYPFMMPDGVTLYYSSDGKGSMGGYDIFVASRDATTGEYLQPQNIGMPFNSPYNDYMLAIDEEAGIGWWATDRNRLGDNVTLYIYMVNDLRKNYDPDDEDIIEMARISDYKATQNPNEANKYKEALAGIGNVDGDRGEERKDFNFPIGNGKYYHSMSDFTNRAAFDAMNAYMKALNGFEKTERKLADLRKRYPVNKADNVREEILALEKEIEQKRIELTKLKSNVYRSLKGVK